jgi:putative DNA primase/helicase
LAKRNDSHPTERADLHGKRLVACVESDKNRRLAESLVKELTGGDTIKARRMREDFWSFRPSHTVILITNHRPEVRGTDYGMWRRLRLVPFTVTIPPKKQDKRLTEKLRAEAPGILRWCVEGCLNWQREGGLGEPVEVTTATDEYRKTMDVFGRFIEECCITGPEMKVKRSELYSAYTSWCVQHGETPEGGRAFGETMNGYDEFERFPSNGIWYRGLRLNEKWKGGTFGTDF